MKELVKQNLLLWIGITAFFCYGDDFFTADNLIYFGRQFAIVAAVGMAIAITQDYFVDWMYERHPEWFKGFVSKCLMYSVFNVAIMYIILSVVFLAGSDQGLAEFFSEHFSDYVYSGLVMVCITIGYVTFYRYKYKKALTTKQMDS